jgi:hypothetical protein
VKGPKQSNRAWLFATLYGYFANLTQDERNKLAAELGIQPVINVCFVDPEDGQPAGASRL